MTRDELKDRTRRFAGEIIRLCRTLPAGEEYRVIGRQRLRSGTSVGANYRAACRSRSRAEYLSRLGVVEEEADESGFWIELLADAGFTSTLAADLHREADERTAIVVATRKSLRERP